MDTELALFQTVRGTFNGSGMARAFLSVTHHRWVIKRMSTTAVGTINEPTLSVYRGSENPSALVDFTRRGTDVSETSLELRLGEQLVFVWAGGTVGSQATANIEGSYFLQGKRLY